MQARVCRAIVGSSALPARRRLNWNVSLLPRITLRSKRSTFPQNTTQMKPFQPSIPLIFAAFLSACSSDPSPPTEADARAALEQDIMDSSQGCIKLVEFHRTGEKALGSIMLVHARSKIEFLEDCNWPIDKMVVVTKVVPGVTPNVRKGEQRTVDFTFSFYKTDHGWKTTQMKASESKLHP